MSDRREEGAARELRVAVVGVGRMGTYHVDTWERVPGARVVAVAEPEEETSRRVIGRRPIDWCPDWRALLERDDLDALDVCAPSGRHAVIGLAAVDAGLDLLVEKPVADTVPAALRLSAAARSAGRVLMVGHVERFNPAVAKVAELLGEGRLGAVYRAQATRVGPLPPRIRDAGVAIDLAIHDLDIMQHLLGRDVTSVYAEGARFAHASHEDMLTCLLRFGADGPFGLLDVNWLTPEKRRELTLLGEGGMLRADYLTQDVWWVESPTASTEWEELARVRGDAEGAAVRFALHKVEPLRVELECFRDCVLNGATVPVTGWDGARALAAALAVRESAAARRPIRLLSLPRTPAAPTSS